MKILVIDVGGTSVKFAIWRQRERREFPSGKSMTPQRFATQLLAMTNDWKYDVISIGFPGPVIHGKPAVEPENLGKGWTQFDFEKELKKPVKIINDAAMQALGSYTGGRMLFLGLGTALGSTLILDDVIVPLELGELAYSETKTIKDVLGKSGLKAAGHEKWEAALHKIVDQLSLAFRTEYLVIGGGNAKLLKTLPAGTRRGHNRKAFAGGACLWQRESAYVMQKKHTLTIT